MSTVRRGQVGLTETTKTGATAGSFASIQRKESDAVQLDRVPKPNPRQASEVLDRPLTSEEIGERRDENGRIHGLLALDATEMDDSNEATADLLMQKLAGDHHLDELNLTPVSVRNGKVICQVSGNAAHIEEGLYDQDLEDFYRGADARKNYTHLRRSATDVELHKIIDTSALIRPNSAGQKVPKLPEGIGAEEIEIGLNRYSYEPQARLDFEGGHYEYAPSPDEYSEPSIDAAYPVDMDQETQEAIQEYVEAVAKNYVDIRNSTISDIASTPEYEAMAHKLAVAGADE